MSELTTFAPITGAWIETFILYKNPNRPDFAPITGAWIETKARSRCGKIRLRTHHGCVD